MGRLGGTSRWPGDGQRMNQNGGSYDARLPLTILEKSV
jgi:hypothetical protein